MMGSANSPTRTSKRSSFPSDPDLTNSIEGYLHVTKANLKPCSEAARSPESPSTYKKKWFWTPLEVAKKTWHPDIEDAFGRSPSSWPCSEWRNGFGPEVTRDTFIVSPDIA
jgi:hypothetical protein